MINKETLLQPETLQPVKKEKSLKNLYIETYGCQMNVADSEVVAAIMEMDGYGITYNQRDADAIFINTHAMRTLPQLKYVLRHEFVHAMLRNHSGHDDTFYEVDDLLAAYVESVYPN